MEIVNGLKEEIKKLAAEENINVAKLNEYIRVYERLRAFEITTVQQAEAAIIDDSRRQYYFNDPVGVNVGAIPRMGVGTVPPIVNELGGVFDMIREAVHDVNKPKGRPEIDDYIYWLKFLKDFKNSINKFDLTDRLSQTWDKEIDNLVYKIHQRIFTLMKRKLDESIEKDIQEDMKKNNTEQRPFDI
jgi:hypothetical protein